MADKLTKAQQHIIDNMKDGKTLELMQYTRGPSVWKLYCRDKKGYVTWATVNWRSVDKLEKMGLIVRKKDLLRYPYKFWYELTPTPPAASEQKDGEQ